MQPATERSGIRAFCTTTLKACQQINRQQDTHLHRGRGGQSIYQSNPMRDPISIENSNAETDGPWFILLHSTMLLFLLLNPYHASPWPLIDLLLLSAPCIKRFGRSAFFLRGTFYFLFFFFSFHACLLHPPWSCKSYQCRPRHDAVSTKLHLYPLALSLTQTLFHSTAVRVLCMLWLPYPCNTIYLNLIHKPTYYD